MEPPELDPDILRYYTEEWNEDARLRSGLNELEFVRTRELLRRHLPGSPQRILDVGGASGVHAEWLLDDGHTVDLIDPVPLHIDQAIAALGDRGGFRATLGDGRQIDAPDGAYDAVLLLGPLYHLPDRRERLLVLREAARVARTGAIVVAAAITRFASLFAGLQEGEIFVEEFREIVERDLTDGQHRSIAGRDYFTTAFFHHPDELVRDALDAGLAEPRVFAVEGPVGTVPQLAAEWRDASKRSVLLDLIRSVEEEPTLLGIGPHLLLFARSGGA